MTESKRTRQKPGDKNYVNNKEFHAVMLEWNYAIIAAHYDCVPEPVLPDKAALMIKKICYRLATSPNFNGYTYKEEMIGDALANCMIYANRYCPFRYENPFAYFTQIAYNAFVYRLNSEKKEHQTKARFLHESGLGDIHSVSSQVHDMDMNFKNNYVAFLRDLHELDVPVPPTVVKLPKAVTKTTTLSLDGLF